MRNLRLSSQAPISKVQTASTRRLMCCAGAPPAAPAERGAATSFFEALVINQAIGALIGQGYAPSQAERHLIAEGADAGISGTPSAYASWPGSMRGSRSSGVASVRLGTQPVRDDVSRPPLISQSSSSRRTRR